MDREVVFHRVTTESIAEYLAWSAAQCTWTKLNFSEGDPAPVKFDLECRGKIRWMSE